MTSLRRAYGLAEPIRREMELKIVREGSWRPAVLGGSDRVHEDILQGRDADVEWEDVFRTREELQMGEGEEKGWGIHGEMERKVGISGL
jgi:proteasome maturation protein